MDWYETIFHWTGLVVVLGLILVVASFVWMWAFFLLRNALHETWWITTWMCFKLRKRDEAYRWLRTAIEDDEKKGRNRS